VARIKQAVTQRDFSGGELSADFLERDDTELRGRALQTAANVRLLTAGGLEQRPGTRWVGNGDYVRLLDATLAGQTYALLLTDQALIVMNQDGSIAFQQSSDGFWTDASALWVQIIEGWAIIGDPRGDVFGLRRSPSGSWRMGGFTFDGFGTDTARQPYWAFETGRTITPSGRTGIVTVTADADVFGVTQPGTIIRYVGQEIVVLSYDSPTQVTGEVRSSLPPSFDIQVASTAEFAVGQVVIGQDSGFTGIIAEIDSATILKVLTTENFDGPDVAEKLSGPNATQDVVAKTPIAPLPSIIWDEQMISLHRGGPRAACAVAGRLCFLDFPQAPDAIAISSARSFRDFQVGTADDDAIVRRMGDNGPRFRHGVSAGDLLLFSDKGTYVQDLRDALLTPSTFSPVLVDARACSGVSPAVVADGVVFVGSDEQTILAALLDGNIYLKWSVRPLNLLARSRDKKVQFLCGPSLAATQPESYLLALHNDGTVSAMSWSQTGEQTTPGFVTWQTNGFFVTIAPIFGSYWFLVDRIIGDENVRSIEWLDYSATLDCSVFADPNAPGAADHLEGSTVAVTWQGRFVGLGLVDLGAVAGMQDVQGEAEIGLPFNCLVRPWPVELIESPYAGLKQVRTFRVGVSVQHTGPFQISCNFQSRTVGGYAFNEDWSQPPPLREGVFIVPVTGRPRHNDIIVKRDDPGAWRILALTQEVQG